MTKENKADLMDKIVSLCKRRGFIFPCCEIYGGFANSYSFGPYGVELKNNIKRHWWKKFVHDREDMVGIDGPILLHPKLWEASGHTTGFNDALVDCKKCKGRFRADHLVEALTGEDMEGRLEDMSRVLKEKKALCPSCGESDWTDVQSEKRILEKIWPGKVSVILPVKNKEFHYIHRGTGKIAFRMPKSQTIRNILRKSGPLVAPSANPESFPPAKNIREAKKYFEDSIDFYIGGRISDQPSTLILIEKSRLKVLREGAVGRKRIEILTGSRCF